MITSQITIPVAFFAGLLSFFAPCVMPLLPVYIAYVTGISLNDLRDGGYKKYRKRMIVSSLLYILGFSLIFTLMGVSAAGIGGFFRIYAREFQIFSGFLLIFFGLQFSEVLRINKMGETRSIKLPRKIENLKEIRSFFIGIIFALTWTPCVGAILGGILSLAAVSRSAFLGGVLLFSYSLGISLPFLAVSFSLIKAPKYLKIIQTKTETINKIASLIMIILGLLLLTGYYAYLNQFVQDFAYQLGYKVN